MERVHHVSKNFIAWQAYNKMFNLGLKIPTYPQCIRKKNPDTVPDTSSNITNKCFVGIKKPLPPKCCQPNFLPVGTFKLEDCIITWLIFKLCQLFFICL